MEEYRTGERSVEYVAPQPDAALKKGLPAYLLRVRIRKSEEGRTALSFLVARDPAAHLKRFDVSYTCDVRRGGGLDVMAGTVSCGGETDGAQMVVCHALLGEDGEDVECIPETLFAWVSETEADDGTVRQYGRELFHYGETGIDAGIRYACTEDPLAAEVPEGSVPAEENETGRKDKKDKKDKKKAKDGRRKSNPLVYALVAASVIVAAAVGVALVVAAVFVGYHGVMFRSLTPEVGALIEAGRQDLAEDFVSRYLGDNIFYQHYADELTSSVDALCAEKNWSEAYAVSRQGPYASLTERVCRDAAADALEREDWEEAYLFAAACPEPYGEEIAAEAASHVWDPEEGTWNEEAYLTAQQSSDPAVLETLAGLLTERYYAAGDAVMTRAAADRMTDRDAAAVWYERLRQDELRAVVAEKSDEEVLRYLEAHEADLKDPSLIGEYRDRLFKAAWSERRLADVFRMAQDWGYDTASLSVSAEDPDVRADLADYFLLTSEQMRAYHAGRISAAADIAFIDGNGTVTWPENGGSRTITGANAVSAGPFIVSVLKKDGTVSAYATSAAGSTETGVSDEDLSFLRQTEALTGVVAMASGERHTAYLHEDGTVTVIGSNENGQANTGGWRDIVAVAAGESFTVGLRADGTAVACGSIGDGMLTDYRNIVDVRACARTVIFLFRDGTAEAVGERSMGLADVSGFRDIRRLRAGCGTVIAEKKDGSYQQAGGGAEGAQGSVNDWKNETDFAVGNGFVVRMDADGTVRADGAGMPKNP